MTATGFIVAIDQGTTSSRAILYDISGKEIRSANRPVKVSCPADGWVEQDAEELWTSVRDCLKEVTASIAAKDIRAIGLTNQRETTVVWDKKSGKPLAPAIVWQCRRSSDICEALRKRGLSETVKEKTGLVIDSYFSASKIIWLLENIAGLKEKVASGQAVFGTVDSWILYRLTKEVGEPVFKTEPSNASRTMLFSLQNGSWDDELLKIAGVSKSNLAEVVPSTSHFGEALIDGVRVPITGILGDQQASLFGHGGITENAVKCTFGTGAFLLLNKGTKIPRSETGLLSTVAWKIGEHQTVFALEGSVFIAGALIQWLRDGLQIIKNSAESEALAASVASSEGVVIVPAFVGLGAPYWDEHARGTITGLTRGATKAHIARAALEAIAHQVADLTAAKEFADVKEFSIDGGMSQNKLFCQILADLTGKQIKLAPSGELTAFGAGRAAALGIGFYRDSNQVVDQFVISQPDAGKIFSPKLSANARQSARLQWASAIKRTISRTLG